MWGGGAMEGVWLPNYVWSLICTSCVRPVHTFALMGEVGGRGGCNDIDRRATGSKGETDRQAFRKY